MLYLSKIDNIKFYKPQKQLFQNDKTRCQLIFIGALLVVIALLIGIEVQALLIGQSMDPDQRAQMLEFLQHVMKLIKFSIC
jgi:hypothetical protein